ncbi:MAG: hypothetical protein FWF79_02465 [Defluviitaleaceae bacterium]|nr:hypothetical protein [Defluviitaleaceae bacterium]
MNPITNEDSAVIVDTLVVEMNAEDELVEIEAQDAQGVAETSEEPQE